VIYRDLDLARSSMIATVRRLLWDTEIRDITVRSTHVQQLCACDEKRNFVVHLIGNRFQVDPVLGVVEDQNGYLWLKFCEGNFSQRSPDIWTVLVLTSVTVADNGGSERSERENATM
jgi:hypothetical protein